ncbi:CD99 antigen-like protein 2 isoform X1 [Carcharodon carcharias]|uniref:CD99 antigen-like protein 2 isoform X1 n=1 Tax=Carcharodon carcharias TaxID=13397 RepID=UPI001B7DD844|nr:CD99 antigen-like protein 2 isoform X1 [Carcharodon carcharias]
MANALRVVFLCATFTLLTGRVLGDDYFDLLDALSDDVTTKPPPAKPRNPSGGIDTGDFDYSDLLDFDTPSDKQTTTKAPRRTTTTKAPKKAIGDDDFSLWDLIQTTSSPRKTTKSPKTTKKPQKKGNSDPNDFDLLDAVDDSNDNRGKGGKGDSDHPSVPGSKGNDKPKGGKQMGASDISDKDLEDLLDDGSYKPDKKKSGDNVPSDDQDQVAIPETTIAGIASAVAAALLGAVSSYIAYQKKQLCFKMQGSLNQQYVKGENAEAGAMTEPQVERSLLQTQSEKPSADNANQI